MSRLRYFPISCHVADRLVVIAGDGAQALQKLRLLVRSQARIVLYAPAPEPDLRAFAIEHGVEHVTAEPDGACLSGAALLFVATGDEAIDTRLSTLARSMRVLVNVVDRPALSDFAVPAIVDRAPVAIAISTDGFAPVLAQHVRALIEALLSPNFGRLGELAAALRAAVTARLPELAARRRFWETLFTGRAADLALAGQLDQATALARADLAKPQPARQAGKLFLVGAGPGAQDLLTLRAQRLLQSADVIVHDALVPDELIATARRDADRICVGKLKGRHSIAQWQINEILVRLVASGKRVVRLKAGDPMVFGRAGEEIAALRAAKLSYEIVPGVTAAFAAAADTAIALTLRGVAAHLIMSTGHGADGSEPAGWESIAAAGGTVALYMGRSVADRIVARLLAAGLDASTPVVAVENAGRRERRVLAGTLAELPALARRPDITGPVIILLGPAVAHGDLAEAMPFARIVRAAA